MEKLVNQQTLEKYYKNKKVFVTGHTGFKGSWLIALLSELGANIKGYALEPPPKGLFNLIQPLNLLDSVIADIRNKEQLTEAIVKFQPDYIFHLAAQPLVRRSYVIPAETFEVNVIGTANLLESVKFVKKPCVIIIVTTDKVYENREEDVLYKESDVLGGYDPYSASKTCTEIVVNSFRNSFFNTGDFDTHQKVVATVRAGNVIGGGDFSDDRIIPDIVRALSKSKIIEVRNPNAVRPWQHVLEPLGGYLLLGGMLHQAPLKFSGAYNFGPMPADHLSVKALVDLSIGIWGSGAWKPCSDSQQPHEANLLKLDIDKARRMLDWQPKLSAVEAIKWTFTWYKIAEKNSAYTFQQIRDYMSL